MGGHKFIVEVVLVVLKVGCRLDIEQGFVHFSLGFVDVAKRLRLLVFSGEQLDVEVVLVVRRV